MYRLFALLSLYTSQVFSQAIGELHQVDVVTEELPPYQILNEDQSVSGITTDRVRELFSRVGLEPNIQMMPWARAFKTSLDNRNTFIYSIVRTPERENKFQWVGVLANTDTRFVRLASRTDLRINALKDSKDYKIGVKRNDAVTDYLKKELGTENLVFLPDSKTILRMLVKGRVDLLPVSQVHLEYLCQHLGYKMSDFVETYVLEGLGSDFYLAANKDTSVKIVTALRKELVLMTSSK